MYEWIVKLDAPDPSHGIRKGVIDNEWSVNISLYIHRDNEVAKLDDSSKSGRDSSEVELESLGDTTKIDQFSEGKTLTLYSSNFFIYVE